MDLTPLVMQCTPANVSTQTMNAIMRVESAHRPLSIGYKIIRKDGKVFTLDTQPRTKDQAVKWARWFQENGYEFDAGAVQVHSTNFQKYGLTVESVFDPCQNIRAGALILAECYDRALPKPKEKRAALSIEQKQTALKAALSCYQSGNFSTGFRTGYVAKVVAAAR